MSRHDLSTPRPPRRSIGLNYDPDAFGQFAEGVARFIGTARFLVFQSGVIVVWISVNTFVPFDGSQFAVAHPAPVVAGRLRGAVDPPRPEPPGNP